MTRLNSILIRNDETDVIKLLSDYAKAQGSKNPEKLYMVYTKLVYKVLDIESGLRGTFNPSLLSVISTLEIMISQTVIELMKDNIHYKLIYKEVKKKLYIFKDLIYIHEIYENQLRYNIKLVS